MQVLQALQAFRTAWTKMKIGKLWQKKPLKNLVSVTLKKKMPLNFSYFSLCPCVKERFKMWEETNLAKSQPL